MFYLARYLTLHRFLCPSSLPHALARVGGLAIGLQYTLRPEHVLSYPLSCASILLVPLFSAQRLSPG